VAGDLYAEWGLRGAPREEESAPAPDRLRQAVAAAKCGGLAVDSLKATVQLSPGVKIEPWGFGEGLAVDRLAEVLKASGYESFLIRVGSIWRAAGPGPEGDGWIVELPTLPGQRERAGRVRLQDAAMALILDPRKNPASQGKGFAGYLNQRTGRPPEGTLATAAITSVALDAQGLAVALFALGSREGQFRLGSLQPKPSASWWMGSGEGEAVQVSHRWSEATRP
jgi:thiamine biosynthesis lipoprotein